MDSLQKQFQEKAFGKPVYIPKFFMHATVDPARSAQYGIKVYKEELFVQIKTKGRKDNTVRKATEDDIAAFSHAYEKFVNERSQVSQSLETLPGYSNAVGFTFRDLGVTTIDELLAFKGPFPLAEMKQLWHIARYIMNGMEQYEPPVFRDDPPKEIYNGKAEAERAALLYAQGASHAGSVGERTVFSEPPSNGAGGSGLPPIVGVSFDENGVPHYRKAY